MTKKQKPAKRKESASICRIAELLKLKSKEMMWKYWLVESKRLQNFFLNQNWRNPKNIWKTLSGAGMKKCGDGRTSLTTHPITLKLSAMKSQKLKNCSRLIWMNSSVRTNKNLKIQNKYQRD